MKIDHIYCINMKKSVDRRLQASSQFEKHGLNVEFFVATDGNAEAPNDLVGINKGEYGCADSHIRIWRDIVKNNYNVSLIFEDDVHILDNFNTDLQLILKDLETLDWDICNISPLIFRPEDISVSNNLTKGKTVTTTAYLINKTIAKQLAQWETRKLCDPIDIALIKIPLNMMLSKKLLCSPSMDYGKNILLDMLFKKSRDTIIGNDRKLDYNYFLRIKKRKIFRELLSEIKSVTKDKIKTLI